MSVNLHTALLVIFNATVHLLRWVFVVPLSVMLLILSIPLGFLELPKFLRCHQRFDSSGSRRLKFSPHINGSAFGEVLFCLRFLQLRFSHDVESRIDLVRSQRGSLILIAWSQSGEIDGLLRLQATGKGWPIQPGNISFHFTHLLKMTLKLPVCDPTRALLSARVSS